MSFPIQLRPSDSETLLTAKSDELLQSSTLRIILEDFEDDLKTGKNVVIPVDVKREALSKILEWMKEHNNDLPVNNLLKWDTQFYGKLSMEQLCDLISGAHYLGIEVLIDQACQRAADLISGRPGLTLKTTESSGSVYDEFL